MFPILQWAPPLCFPVCVCVWYRQEQEALLKWKDRVKWRRVFWIIFHPLVPAPSPPCSCFTIELHSRDKGCDADINDGWQRARFYVWWPIKGCQKNSRKISKKYPFFCDLAPYSHKFLPMNNTPPPSRPPHSFWRNSRLWLTRRNAEPKRTETNHIFCCSSWSDVSTKESVNLFCV